MKFLVTMLFTACSVFCFAQDTSNRAKGLPDAVNVWKATLLSPGISHERKALSSNQTVYMHAYAATSFGVNFSSSRGTNAFLNFDPGATVQYRFYYNGKQRSEKGRRTALNSMNYIAGSLSCMLTRETFAQNYIVPDQRRPFFSEAILWGMQRNYPKRFSLDLYAGPAFYQVRSLELNAEDVVEKKLTSGFNLAAGISIGWWLNSRK